MSSRKQPGLCEPNFYIPQYVNLEAMRQALAARAKTEAAEKDAEHQQTSGKPKYSHEPIDTAILPKFDSTSDQLKRILSLHHNDYLRQKFNRFLDHPPQSMFKVRLFRDLHVVKPQPRPLTLNGHFYDIHNKLAPIPHIPDPRQVDTKSNISDGKKDKRENEK